VDRGGLGFDSGVDNDDLAAGSDRRSPEGKKGSRGGALLTGVEAVRRGKKGATAMLDPF
jgi:hypothetical protein